MTGAWDVNELIGPIPDSPLIIPPGTRAGARGDEFSVLKGDKTGFSFTGNHKKTFVDKPRYEKIEFLEPIPLLEPVKFYEYVEHMVEASVPDYGGFATAIGGWITSPEFPVKAEASHEGVHRISGGNGLDMVIEYTGENRIVDLVWDQNLVVGSVTLENCGENRVKVRYDAGKNLLTFIWLGLFRSIPNNIPPGQLYISMTNNYDDPHVFEDIFEYDPADSPVYIYAASRVTRHLRDNYYMVWDGTWDRLPWDGETYELDADGNPKLEFQGNYETGEDGEIVLVFQGNYKTDENGEFLLAWDGETYDKLEVDYFAPVVRDLVIDEELVTGKVIVVDEGDGTLSISYLFYPGTVPRKIQSDAWNDVEDIPGAAYDRTRFFKDPVLGLNYYRSELPYITGETMYIAAQCDY